MIKVDRESGRDFILYDLILKPQSGKWVPHPLRRARSRSLCSEQRVGFDSLGLGNAQSYFLANGKPITIEYGSATVEERGFSRA